MNFETFNDLERAVSRSRRNNIFELLRIGVDDEGLPISRTVDFIRRSSLPLNCGVIPVSHAFMAHFGNNVVKPMGTGQGLGNLLFAYAMDQRGKGVDAHGPKKCAKQTGFVFAIAVSSIEDGGDVVRLVGMFANREGDVANVVLNEAEGLANALMKGVGVAQDVLDDLMEFRRKFTGGVK